MTVADYLIDTSALARVLLRQNTAEWDDRIGAGLVAICDPTELDVGVLTEGAHTLSAARTVCSAPVPPSPEEVTLPASST